MPHPEEFITIIHPETGGVAKARYKSWKHVHSLPEHGGWELYDEEDTETGTVESVTWIEAGEDE